MDDLISKQAVLDEIEYELEMINSTLDSATLDFNARERLRQRKGEAREILNYIQQLPPVQSERKKGYWIERPIAGCATVRCSVCTELFWKNRGIWNFCPNCGAEMEEEK